MTKTILRADTPTDVTATSSIFETLFKHKESHDNPQEDDGPSATKEKEPEHQLLPPVKQPALLPVKQPTLLADLYLLQQLTKQLKETTLSSSSNNHDDDNAPSMSAETESLATLYCRRAATLLAFVDYDATTSVPLDILALGPSASTSKDEANQPVPMLEAVRQALQDSQAAAALTSSNATLAEAHLLSAYCSRSLGELSHARAFTALAATALPDSILITNLAEQLDVEARSDVADLLPKLRMSSAALSTLATTGVAQTIVNQQEVEENNNDQPELMVTKTPSSASPTIPVEQSSFWSQVATHFQVLEEAAHSSWLDKLERLMHQNVHHHCALPSETRQLDAALQATFASLALLLQSGAACSTLGLNMTDDAAARTLEKLTQAASSSPQLVVQNRTARKWIVQTWAPAVRRAVVSASKSPLIDLSSDVLLMLSRLLQASGSWRQCTAMAHSLAYAEMSYDLAKLFRGNFTDPSAWTRLEMQCAEAFAIAQLQRTTGHKEALKTFRETLQAALHVGDQEYELRARLHVARTLRLKHEPEIAHAELVQLLERSRALNDVHIEAIAEYEMGEHFVQQEDIGAAHEHFQAAQALCNRTANFRRGAMRCSVSSLLHSVNDADNDDNDESEVQDGEESDMQEEEECQRPKERRQAFCLKETSLQPRSLMSTLMNTTGSNVLYGPKPKRTMSWRETVFASTWPGDSNAEEDTQLAAPQQSKNDRMVMMILAKNSAPVLKTVGQQARGMATEKQILQRITATSNIAKITKSMKMVSAAKMRGAENRMNDGRPFTAWLDNVKGAHDRTVETDGVAPAEELEGDNVFVVVSSDAGLCGGINSGIAKTTRRQIAGIEDHSQIFVIGDKARAQLRRDLGDNIRGNVTETYQSPPNFTVASAIAEAVVATSPSESEKVHVLYNKFKSAISYMPSVRSLAVQPDSDAFDLYELEPDNKDELIADLKEFEIATAIFQGMIENSTSEQSSRMAAMENATSNAEDLIGSLTIVYNKARQARITTELIEIISGAASLDG
ncbi:hypothetical protein JG687_00003200 [Phytophthora cactorum]|uniref:F-ATPase gamma subunit n=2 Tax=Phytophthora cactorum TaxID=29920 RepID=A0A8T1US87_9STRA|nr:hypothetical protein JG687_00003200 [Phytophthora cactorum]